MNITQPGRESFNCYSLILSDWELFCLVPDAPPVSALFLLAAFSGPGLLSLHLNLSLCLREETPERERDRARDLRNETSSERPVRPVWQPVGWPWLPFWAGRVSDRGMSAEAHLTRPGHLCHTCHTAAGHTRDTRDKDVVTWRGWGEAGGWLRGYCSPLTCSSGIMQPRQRQTPGPDCCTLHLTAALQQLQAGVCDPRCMQSPRSVPCSTSRSNVVTLTWKISSNFENELGIFAYFVGKMFFSLWDFQSIIYCQPVPGAVQPADIHCFSKLLSF